MGGRQEFDPERVDPRTQVIVLRKRVARLDARVMPSSVECSACWDWTPRVFVVDGEDGRPETCPTCRRQVPIRLIRIYSLRESPQPDDLPLGL